MFWKATQARSAVWNKLTEFLGETWPHENGFDLALKRVAVDSGYATQRKSMTGHEEQNISGDGG